MKAIRVILACIRKADEKYNLINHGDKIIVGLSGGKDSIALLYALTLYQKFSHTEFAIQPVTLDLGFPGFNPEPLKEFCKSLNLTLHVEDSKEVYPILKAQQKHHAHLPCSICSRMKKAAINNVANELGFNKVAFAHHADDAVETLFMNEIHGGRIATFSPKMHLENANITFIRPLILCHESNIIRFMKEEKFVASPSHCPADKETTREDIKNYLKEIYNQYPSAKDNFVMMLDNYKKEDLWGKQLYYQLDNCWFTLKPVISREDQIHNQRIRYEVFVKEMGISMDDEFDVSTEFEAVPFLICLNGKPIGTIRYRFLEDKLIKIERITMLKEYRRKGYTSKAISFLVDMLWKEYNPVTFTIHSMAYVRSLYEKLGFIPEGEEYIEADIPHISLYKK